MRYDEALRARLRENLGRHERWAVPPSDGLRPAAVAVVVVDSDPVAHGADAFDVAGASVPDIPGVGDFPFTGSVGGTAGGPAVLLTRRAARLRAHAGQWAFPGGRLDPGEEAAHGALRELSEELGLTLGEEAVLGVLDDYVTRSGYRITPLVVWGGADPELRPDPAEVLSVHRISLRELRRPDSPRFVTIPESPRPVIQLPIGGDLVHAPTAAILHQFRRVAVEGVEERVADYEQPVFAWR